MSAPPDLSELLQSARAGDAQAADRLFELVYADLKRMAHSRLRGNQGLGELDTTSLVHESYLRLVDRGQLKSIDGAAFFGYVGRVMRSVLIDHVREQQALKRGGDATIVTLTTSIEGEVIGNDRLLAIDAALQALQRIAPDYHDLVEMRYFAGLSIRELAEMRGMSTRSVEREWDKARAFLLKLMQEG